MQAVGLDGCPAGWVAVVLEDGRFAGARVVASLTEALAAFPEAAAVGVDMPIGLPEQGKRRSDEEARAFIRPLQSSVFWTPPREAIEAETQAEGVAICHRLDAPGMSAQCYALREKILEVREAAGQDARVFEVHPEVSFRALAERPLAGKRTWAGLMARVALLDDVGIIVPRNLDLKAKHAADDLLDAAAVAWSAWRKAEGKALTLPAAPTGAERAGSLVIWY